MTFRTELNLFINVNEFNFKVLNIYTQTYSYFQLVKKENVKAVVSMNEDYELWLLSNNAEVSSIIICK